MSYQLTRSDLKFFCGVISVVLLSINRTFSRERLPLWTPGSVPLCGSCMCFDCWEQFPEYTPMFWPWYRTWLSQNYERFPWSICDGCGMPAGSAYPSGHLVLSPFLGLAYAHIVETRFLELAMSLLDFSPWIPLGTFSILLWCLHFLWISIMRKICLSYTAVRQFA